MQLPNKWRYSDGHAAAYTLVSHSSVSNAALASKTTQNTCDRAAIGMEDPTPVREHALHMAHACMHSNAICQCHMALMACCHNKQNPNELRFYKRLAGRVSDAVVTPGDALPERCNDCIVVAASAVSN